MPARKSKAAKPPEGRKEANTSNNWRSKEVEDEESEREDDGAEETPVEPSAKSPELPYRAVPPVDTRSKDLRLDHIGGMALSEGKAYQVKAPVQKEGLGRRIADKVLGTEVTMGIRELAGVSPEVREAIRKDLTKTRKPMRQVSFVEDQVPLPFVEDEELRLEYDALNMDELPRVSSVFVTTIGEEDIPEGSVVVNDPYLQYLESLAPNEIPKQVYLEPRQIYVARDSANLRVVFPSVNKQGKIESVMDSGSQIVSMSLEQAALSKLQWDPDIQIIMQSANRTLEKSVGLAKNVPFKFGDITVYLQVHIIRGPAYKVLLGRPFEILTECQINNNRDDTQTITLKDPNTGRRCSMTTFPRGRESEQSRKPRAEVEVEEIPEETADPETPKQGFRQASMT